MLTVLRKSVGSWVAKIFILLLVASFGVWGVSGAILGGNSGSVVQVGGTGVSINDYVLAYERTRTAISRQFGRLLTREEIRAFGMEGNVLSQLVSGALLDESARRMGLGLSTKNLASLIGEDETFQDASGNFDRRSLAQQLAQIGMSESDYVENRQSVAVRNQLLEAISANTQSSQTYIDAYNKYRSEKRVFEYAIISADMLSDVPVPTTDDIKAYFEKNKTDYIAPEYRKLIMVKLEPEDVSDQESVSPDEVEDEYEARKSEFRTEEKRSIQQLTLEDETQGNAIIERLKGGELFETVLSSLGKTENDIDIGEYTQKDLPDTNVATAAFSLKLNEVSGVVTGIFGPVLLRVTRITPETVKPLSEVEDDLRKRLALIKAGEELFDIHDKLEDERASGDNLSEAARKVKLKVRVIEKIDASGRLPDGELVNDLPESANLLRQLFETAQGVETDPITITGSGFVWYEVGEVYNQRQKEFEEVKDEVSATWVIKETANRVEKIAAELKSKLDDGDDFAATFAAILPEAFKDRKVERSAELGREDSSNDLSRDAVRSGFAVANDKATLAPGVSEGDQVVLKVVNVIAGTDNSVGPEEKTRLDEEAGNDLLNQLIGDLQGREDVVISQRAILAAQNLIR